MIIILSPSKTMDYTSKLLTKKHTIPEFLDGSVQLIKYLRDKTPAELMKLMDISNKLAALNFQRYQDFYTPFTTKNARQAILAFKGDVYEGIDIENYSESDFSFAQEHLRILSGLYGLLKPLDLIQPYRLEMGIKLANPRGKDLYEFWDDRITKSLNSALHKQKSPLLINLASQEYFKSVHEVKLDGELLNIIFKEGKGSDFKIIGLFAKAARGKMANFIIKNRTEKAADLRAFNDNGYKFNKKLSDSKNYVFTRAKP